MAFPLFCYCLTVGMLYTRDIKRYLARLGLFALISQLFWILAFNYWDFWGNLTNLNIYFTLFMSLLSVWGFKEKKWLLFVGGVFLLSLINFDYSISGVILMLIFYLCRHRPALGAALYTLSYLPALAGGSLEDPLAFTLGPVCAGVAKIGCGAPLQQFQQRPDNLMPVACVPNGVSIMDKSTPSSWSMETSMAAISVPSLYSFRGLICANIFGPASDIGWPR